MTVKEILDYLNEAQIRCTYHAFGELTGTPAQSVAKQHLGERRPEASWVVSGDTGEPTGYSRGDMHPNLLKNAVIIRTGEELSRSIREFQQQRQLDRYGFPPIK